MSINPSSGVRVLAPGNSFIDEFLDVRPSTIRRKLMEVKQLGVSRLLVGADPPVNRNFQLFRHVWFHLYSQRFNSL